MQYSKFGKTGLNISKLGFGSMRMPILNENNSEIDEEKSKEMLYYAINNGINYIDTAYNYHEGKSEEFLGRALKDGYRQKIYLATKLPVWKVEKYEDFEMYLDEQLERLKTDYIDFYLLHALGISRWNKIKNLKVFDFIKKAKESGKIKYMGFSFHDKLEAFKEIVDSYNWDFCQIQLNYMDQNYQAGIEGLNYAAAKDIPVIIMEPVKGGKLASNSNEDINKLWNDMPVKRSPAQWALKWLFNNEKVSLVLSGMSELKHVKENIEAADETTQNSLTKKELEIIDKVKGIFDNKTRINCTGCEYCMPCPNNIPIPFLFEDYNNIFLYDDDKGKKRYKRLMDKGCSAKSCVECRKCESMCPQNINIVDKLKELHEFYMSN